MSWVQQPVWIGPYAGNYKINWIFQNAHNNYIDDNGQLIEITGVLGSWVDDPTAPIINGTTAQRFVPANTDGPAAVYQAGTMYGCGGSDLWVLNAAGKAALEEAKKHPITCNTPPEVAVPLVPRTINLDMVRSSLAQIEGLLSNLINEIGK